MSKALPPTIWPAAQLPVGELATRDGPCSWKVHATYHATQQACQLRQSRLLSNLHLATGSQGFHGPKFLADGALFCADTAWYKDVLDALSGQIAGRGANTSQRRAC